MGSPDVMREILVTRPEPGLTETSSALRRLGFAPVSACLLAIETRTLALDPAIRLQAILVTSAHALPALEPLAQGAGPVLLTVGDATAAKARAIGFAAVRSAAGNADALAVLCRRVLVPEGGPLLLAVGETQGAALAGTLRHFGFKVIRRVAYVQRPVGAFPRSAIEALEGGRVASALFLSSSAATCFARLLPPGLRARLATVDALGISEAATSPVAALPWKRVRVALRPTSEDVLALL